MDTRKLVEEELCIEKHCSELGDFEVDFKGLFPDVDNKIDHFKNNEHVSKIKEDIKSEDDDLFRRESSKDGDLQLVDDNFAFLYYTIAGKDEKLDAFELQRVLTMVFRAQLPVNGEFSLETCRSMMASNDFLRVGKLTYIQFKKLWLKIVKWVYTFDKCEKDKDGKINFRELSSAMKRLKLEVDEQTTQKLMFRFQGRKGLVELDDFLQICCKAETARKSFEKVKDGKATFELFFMEILYN